jgi:phosphatidylinositol alpha-1,6-mannosyltransferase
VSDPPVERILVMTPNYQGADGVSSFSRSCLAAFAKVRGDVEVWSFGESAVLRALPGTKARFFGGSKAAFLASAASRALRSQRGTLVFCTHLGLAPAAATLALRGARMGAAILGIEAWRPLGRIDAWALRRACKLTAISNYSLARFHAANSNLKNIPAEAVPLCIEPAQSATTTDEAKGEEPDAPYALIVARMSADERYKGHDELIEVWPQVLAQVPEARLKVAGGGDDSARLAEKARDSGLSERIEFLGRVTDPRLRRLYEECAYYVMPSPGEGFGLVFLEAMRAGKAAIGAPGAAQEIIVPEETGLIVDPQDRGALAAALVRLFQDEPLRTRMGEAGRRREREEFSFARFAERMQSALGISS